MRPLISLIIPVYNHAESLQRSLFSVSRQIYRPLEIIVVNDGSTDDFDGAKEQINKQPWAAELNIKFLSQPRNMGAPAARNRGLAEAKGDYVIFWDADTIAGEMMLEKMYAALVAHPEVSYAYSGFYFGWKKFRSRSFSPQALLENNYIDTTSLVRRADAIPFDEKLKRFQDWDLWLTMLQMGKIGVFVPEVLYKKEIGKREGLSRWLPSMVYRLPWKTKRVRDYEEAKEIVSRKHLLRP